MLPDPLRLHPDVRFRSVPPEGVLVKQSTAEVLVVNDLGLRVVELLQDGHGRAELLAVLLEEYEAAEEVIRSDLTAFLEDLLSRGLLAPEHS